MQPLFRIPVSLMTGVLYMECVFICLFVTMASSVTVCYTYVIIITIIFIDPKICSKYINFINIFILAYIHKLFHVLAYTIDQQYIQMCGLIIIIVVQKNIII